MKWNGMKQNKTQQNRTKWNGTNNKSWTKLNRRTYSKYRHFSLSQSKNQNQSQAATMHEANQRNRTRGYYMQSQSIKSEEPTELSILQSGRAHGFEDFEIDGLQCLSFITNNISGWWEMQLTTRQCTSIPVFKRVHRQVLNT